MNINKKLATKVFSRLTYYKQYKKTKGKFVNNGEFEKDYPKQISYHNNCGLGFVAYKIYGDSMYEIFPTTNGRTTLISFYVEV